MTDILRQDVRILRCRRIVGKHLQNRAHIADRDTLAQEIGEHLLHFAHGEQIRNDLLDESRVGLLEIVEQVLRLLTPEDLRRMLLDDLRQVGCEHGDRIHDRVAVQLRLLAFVLRDPECGEAERRLRRLDARHLLKDGSRVHCEIVVEHQLAARNLHALQLDDVGIGFDLDIVTDTDGRHNKSELQRTLTANHDDAVEEIAALARIDERDKTVADLELHRVDLQERDNILGRRCFLLRLGFLLDLLDFLLHRLAAMEIPCDKAAECRKGKERNARQPRHNREEEEHARENHKDTRVAEELLDEITAEIPLCRRARDDDTGRRRDEERGDLCDESLTDSQQRIGLECLCCIHIALEHPNDKTAADVDHHDDNGGDGIALDKLRCTVHCAEEVRLALHLLTAALRLRICNRPLVEIRVDRHLFAWHRIEGETRRHLGNTFRALRDNDEVHNDEDDEHDKADDRITADNEISECRNDLAGVRIEQNQTR